MRRREGILRRSESVERVERFSWFLNQKLAGVDSVAQFGIPNLSKIGVRAIERNTGEAAGRRNFAAVGSGDDFVAAGLRRFPRAVAQIREECGLRGQPRCAAQLYLPASAVGDGQGG